MSAAAGRASDARAGARWLLGAALAGAVFALSADIASFAEVPKRTAIQLCVALALACWAVSGPQRLRLPAEAWAAAGFCLWAGAGVLRAEDPFPALEVWIHWLACLAAYGLVLQTTDEPQRWLQALAGAGAATAGVGLLRGYGALPWLPGEDELSGLFGNRNWQAQVLVTCLPALAACWIFARRAAWVWAAALGTACSLALVLKTTSTTAYLVVALQGACAAGLLLARHRREVFVRLLRGRTASTAAAAALGLLLVSTGPGGFVNPLSGATRELAGTLEGAADDRADVAHTPAYSTQDRLGAYRVAVSLWQSSPILGLGLMDYWSAFPRANHELGSPALLRLAHEQRHAHSDALQIAAELGAVGVLLVLATLALALRRVLARRDALPVHAWASAVALAGLALNALLDFPLYNAAPPLLAALYLGVLGHGAGREHDLGGFPARPAVRAVAGVLALLLVVACGAWRHAVWTSEWHLARLAGALSLQDWQTLEEHAAQVAGGATGRSDPLPYLAQARLARGDAEGALAATALLLGRYPQHPTGLALRAAALESRGELEEATLAWRRAAELVPVEWRLHLRAARGELRQGSGERAAALLRRALSSIREAQGRALLREAAAADPELSGNPHIRRALGESATADPGAGLE